MPGQEEENPIYIQQNGIGFDSKSTDDIFNKIDLLLENNREKLVKMREAQFDYYGRNVRDSIAKYLADNI